MTTLRANKIKDGYIRLIVSRGDGDLGLRPPQMLWQTQCDHHHGQDHFISGGALSKGHGDHHGADRQEPSQRA